MNPLDLHSYSLSLTAKVSQYSSSCLITLVSAYFTRCCQHIYIYICPSFCNLFLLLSFSISLSLFHSHSLYFAIPLSLSLINSFSKSFSLYLSVSIVSLSIYICPSFTFLSFYFSHFFLSLFPTLSLSFSYNISRFSLSNTHSYSQLIYAHCTYVCTLYSSLFLISLHTVTN